MSTDYKYFSYIPNEGRYSEIANMPNFERQRQEEELIKQITESNDSEIKEKLFDELRFFLK